MSAPFSPDFPKTRQALEAFVRQRLGELTRIAVQRIQSTGVAPTGAAGGVLSGTYPNPGFANDMAFQSELDAVALKAGDRYREEIGDGATAVFNIDHNLGSKDVHVTVYKKASGDEVALDPAAATGLIRVTHSTNNRVVVEYAVGSEPPVGKHVVIVRY